MFLFICTIGKKHIITDSVKMDNNIYYSGASEYRNQEQLNNVAMNDRISWLCRRRLITPLGCCHSDTVYIKTSSFACNLYKKSLVSSDFTPYLRDIWSKNSCILAIWHILRKPICWMVTLPGDGNTAWLGRHSVNKDSNNGIIILQ